MMVCKSLHIKAIESSDELFFAIGDDNTRIGIIFAL